MAESRLGWQYGYRWFGSVSDKWCSRWSHSLGLQIRYSWRGSEGEQNGYEMRGNTNREHMHDCPSYDRFVWYVGMDVPAKSSCVVHSHLFVMGVAL